MTAKITLEEALKLVTFYKGIDGTWYVKHVNGNVHGIVGGNVVGDITGSVCGKICGVVLGTINGRKWQIVETPKEKLRRLIEEDADKAEVLEAFNQLEDN